MRIQPSELCEDPWPEHLGADLVEVNVGISRTEPSWGDRHEVREVEALYLAAIAAAKRWIYLESQYITSRLLENALAKRLSEPHGPEVVVVCPAQSGGKFDRLFMDRARNCLIHQLQAANLQGRFRAFAPMAAERTPIAIHSKIMIIDDRLLHVGSANLNNRSFGLDTECDLTIEALPGNGLHQDAIRQLLVRVLEEHTGSARGEFEAAFLRTASLLKAIEAITKSSGHHLKPFDVARLGTMDRLIGASQLLDPFGASDNWRPWTRFIRPRVGGC